MRVRSSKTLLATVVLAALLVTAGCVDTLPSANGSQPGQTTATTTESNTTAEQSVCESITETVDSDRERAEVTVLAANGTELARVCAMVSDTAGERYTGLSDTESLAPNEGMLFVYEEEGEHTYVMRRMDFPLDIIYVGADREINTIHHAPVPPEGTDGNDLKPYPGEGKWVLEVPRNFTTEHNITEGDEIRVER